MIGSCEALDGQETVSFPVGAALPVTEISAGMTLRVVDTVRYKMLYSTDNWATSVMKESRPVGYAGSYVDIDTPAGQTGKIIFTFYWPAQEKWLGRNFEVAVVGS